MTQNEQISQLVNLLFGIEEGARTIRQVLVYSGTIPYQAEMSVHALASLVHILQAKLESQKPLEVIKGGKHGS